MRPSTIHSANRIARTIAIVLAAVFCVSFGASGGKNVSLNSKLGNVQDQIRDVRAKIRQKEGQKRTVIGQLTTTESRLEDAQSDLAINKLKLLDAEADLAQTIERLERTIRQLERRQTLLSSRIVDIYEGEDTGYLNVLLESEDMWVFLTRTEDLGYIIKADSELIRQINEDKAQIEADKARQTQRVAEIEQIQIRLEDERNRISELAEDKRGQLDKIENSRELYEQALDELLAQSRAIEAQIRRIQRSPGGRIRYSKPFSGGLSRPCGGRISSRFGYRVHPITGVYKLHTGVDMATSSGTSIKAAADGVVIIAGWQGAYGYAVVIDHGGGVSTLYGHCSSILVRVGQEVSRGEVIARVGSTGYSTGPHLHFEKRINGTPVNPM